ncbi:putative solute-binding protein family 3/ domain of MltF [Helianthus annuus]|nr:putative solute-binding protein family 3/ domain of MltF [Helianthus annuus]
MATSPHSNPEVAGSNLARSQCPYGSGFTPRLWLAGWRSARWDHLDGWEDRGISPPPYKSCEAVAGDVTVRANRAQYVDFTSAYLSSEVYMLVRASHEWNQTLWTFLKPFTPRLWIAIVGVCIYIGLAVAILEYRVSNPKFLAPIPQRVVMVIWFPISTFFFHEGKIHNKSTKVVLVMWLSMIFIIVQIFTATLSAWLTLDQMRPKLPSSYENVGYQDGSFLKDFITQKYNCSDTKLVPLKTIEEYERALSTHRVNAIFHELPYIELFLAKYGSDYMKFGPINQESGIAFALPRGSPLLQDFSMAVINVTESDTMMKMKEKYLGFRIPDGSQPTEALPQSLDIQSFFALFMLIGTLTIVAIIYSEISHRGVNNKILPVSTEK